MKRFLVQVPGAAVEIVLFVGSLAVLLALMGCSGKKAEEFTAFSAPARISEAQGRSDWKITLHSQCSRSERASCIAGYGFTVFESGEYQIGPGPEGQILSGKLDGAEFDHVVSFHDQLALPAQEEICSDSSNGDSADEIAIVDNANSFIIAKNSETSFCYRSAENDAARSFHKVIRDLAKKYYPTPFPDACIDASLAVEKLYEGLTTCSRHEDCAFLDNTYTPIPRNDLQFVYRDDCTVIKTLPVANAAFVLSAQPQLLTARQQARNVCGLKLMRANCSSIDGFQSIAAQPSCFQNHCVVRGLE